MKNCIVIETKYCNVWNIDWRCLVYSFLNIVNLYELRLENQYEKTYNERMYDVFSVALVW